MTTTATEMFSSNWQVYQKVIHYDYMQHAALGKKLLEVLQSVHSIDGISILDIGCGDASLTSSQLQSIKATSFTGYDMSAPALALAEKNLAGIVPVTALKEGDMQTLLQLETNSFDVIYSSFAIHHLQDDEKQLLLQNCYNHLNENGIMIYTDVFKAEGQSRKDYIDEYINGMEQNWNMLQAGEKQLIVHLQQYDFPATLNDCAFWLHEIGFKQQQVFSADKHHRMIVVKK